MDNHDKPQDIIYICPISWKPCFTVDFTALDSKWHSELIDSINEKKRFDESDAASEADGTILTYFECMFADGIGGCLIRNILLKLNSN